MTAIGGRSSPEKSSSPNGIWLIRELSLDRAVGQPAPRPQRTLVGAAPAHSCWPVRPVFGQCCRSICTKRTAARFRKAVALAQCRQLGAPRGDITAAVWHSHVARTVRGSVNGTSPFASSRGSRTDRRKTFVRTADSLVLSRLVRANASVVDESGAMNAALVVPRKPSLNAEASVVAVVPATTETRA